MKEAGVEEVSDDVLAILTLRYLDGTADAAEVGKLEQMLKRSSQCRKVFLELARHATVISDFHRVEYAASTVMVEGSMMMGAESEEKGSEWDRESWECASEVCLGGDDEGIAIAQCRFHSKRWRTLSVVAAAGAAAMAVISGLMLWWAAEPPSLADSGPLVAMEPLEEVVESHSKRKGESSFLTVADRDDSRFFVNIPIDSEMASLSTAWPDDASEAVPEPPQPPLLFISNALTFWNLCRVAAQCDARQAISSTLLGVAPLEFRFEPYAFSAGDYAIDWIHPRLPFQLMQDSGQREL